VSDFHLRPAKPEDKEAITALSSHIWEGEDYVPDVFSAWLDDAQGRFTVSCEGDTLLGFAKLTRIAAGEWWLEGLRVHPDHRGRGVARQLHRHMVEAAEEEGEGTLRFATAAANTPVHRLAQETGFRQESSYLAASYEVAGNETSVAHLSRATEEELPALRAWLDNSALHNELAGLYEERWQWQSLEPQLAHLVRSGRVFRWRERSGPSNGIVIVGKEEGQRLRLNYVDVQEAFLQPTARELASLAAEWGMEDVLAKLPAREIFRTAFAAMGWQVEEEFELVIFERELGRS
jgi:GNAT superfamily N-acetyltransferase